MLIAGVTLVAIPAALYLVLFYFGPGHGTPSASMVSLFPYFVLLARAAERLDGSDAAFYALGGLQFAAYALTLAAGSVRGRLGWHAVLVVAVHVLGVTACVVVVRWFWA